MRRATDCLPDQSLHTTTPQPGVTTWRGRKEWGEREGNERIGEREGGKGYNYTEYVRIKKYKKKKRTDKLEGRKSKETRFWGEGVMERERN